MGFIMTGQAFFAVLQYNELFSFSWDTYFFPVKQNKQKITRIAKVALHKLLRKSSLHVKSVCHVYPLWLVWPICPVWPGCPACPLCPDDLVTMTTMATITWPWRPFRPWWSSWPRWSSWPQWPSRPRWPLYLKGSWRSYKSKLKVAWSHLTYNMLV